MDGRIKWTLALGAAAVAAAFGLAAAPGGSAGLAQGGGVEIDPDDIGGVVTSASGPEVGVWVIAETTDLPTRFIRIVATDEQGRYVLPDLPDARYDVWVRGYGLVDSERVSARPGQHLDLDAVIAPDPLAAAQVYPAAWWLSMIELPPGEHSQQWLGSMVTGCLSCHQIGNEATRRIPADILNSVDSHLEAWDKRVAMGPMGGVDERRLPALRRAARHVRRLDGPDCLRRRAAADAAAAGPQRTERRCDALGLGHRAGRADRQHPVGRA